MCVDFGQTCSSTVACCEGLVCAGADDEFTCFESCESDDDCPSGVCTELASGGSKICQAIVVLPCAPDGAECGPGTGYGDCCEGLCVTDITSPTGTCGKFCTQASDCSTNCCGDVGSPEGKVCFPAADCQ
jgi:hypothetical protein